MAKVECELITQDTIDVEIAGSGTLLQEKSVDVEYNGTIVVSPDDGFDGLKSVQINTNVPKRFECGDGYFLPITSAQKNLSLISRLQKLDISCWDVSSYTNMYDMFRGYSSLQQLDVSNFDTSKVTSMYNMFFGCSSLKSLDVSNFDTSKVTNMINMFADCSSFKSLDVSNFDTSKVTNMSGMFYGCSSLQQLDVSNFDTSNVTGMVNMFVYCSSLQQLDVSNFDTSKVTNMNNMFQDCLSLKSLDVSNFDTSKVTSMSAMFYSCRSLGSLIGDNTIQDVENGLKTMIGLKVSIAIYSSPLRFSSILALANGLADLTGQTAQTMTIYAQSYNNMYNDDDTIPTADVIAERQARIAAICAAKNWNFAH